MTSRGCGSVWVLAHRKRLVGWIAGVGGLIVGLVCCLVGCAGLSERPDTVKGAHWASYHIYGSYTAYANLVCLYSLGEEEEAGVVTRWSELQGEHQARSCGRAKAEFFIYAVCGTLLAPLVGISTSARGGLLSRWKVEDSSRLKCASVILAVGGIGTLGALVLRFKEECYDVMAEGRTVVPGPGLICVGFGFMMELFCLVVFTNSS